jgi:branched-chain amino acid transport system permease protein
MSDRVRRAMGWLALIVALMLVPLTGNYATSLAAEVLVFAIFAMSLDLLIGYTGLLSFGHAAFFGVSAYTMVILGVHLGWSGGSASQPASWSPRRSPPRSGSSRSA